MRSEYAYVWGVLSATLANAASTLFGAPLGFAVAIICALAFTLVSVLNGNSAT